ncbi:MAG: hypothetical protein AB7F72_00025 [Afipia sp.]
MSTHPADLFVSLRGRTILTVAAVTMAWATAAVPQQVQPQLQAAPSQQPAPPPPSAPPPADQGNPGLVEEIGKLLKDSASGLKSTLSGSGQVLDGLNSGAKDAARGATDGLKRIAPLSGQTVATGRTLCPPAANGAPDCKLAAEQLCKEKGYGAGSSVDIESTQKCSAKAYFSGQSACRTENFVTRAMCQ